MSSSGSAGKIFQCVYALTVGKRGALLLLKPSIIPTFSSVSSDHRLGWQPSPSRQAWDPPLFDLAPYSTVFSDA